MSQLIGLMDSESFLGAVKVDFHDHLVYPTNISSLCEACHNSEERDGCQSGYICKPCNLYVHKDCAEINNTYRHKHPLKLLTFYTQRDNDKTCYLCGKEVGHLFYDCSQCEVSFCNLCPSIPLFIDDVHKKIHEHSLTQMMIKKLHQAASRHDHRVSHTYSLGPGDWVCGVCRKSIDRSCGAYSCFTCSCTYAVHSKCATREDVWDGVELEDVPEDDDEDINDPFEVIGEGVIKHFSHEHHLRSLVDDGDNENRYCYACTLPIHSDPCYTCVEECGFILHQTCANLPKKIRHELSNRQLTLCISPQQREDFESYSFCDACLRQCTGFYYKYEDVKIDVRCAQVSKTFNHGSHQHPLFSMSIERKLCTGCGKRRLVMSCIECDFDLCFYCATLPKEVRHKYDRHPVSLCYGESKSERGMYWCEICEAETNPNEWFYTCNDCGSTLHVDCVLGDYLHVRPGYNIISMYGEEFEVVANDRPTRPFCSSCKERCVQPFVYMSKVNNNTYMCFWCSKYLSWL